MHKYYNVVRSLETVDKQYVYGNLWTKALMVIRRLPKLVDLRPFCSPIVDQGQLGSCTGNAIASGLREYLLIKTTKCRPELVTKLSRLFIYYEERFLENTINQDAGAQISDGLKVIYKMGVCEETKDPYVISDFMSPPNAEALKDALRYRVASIKNLKNLNEIKNCLADRYPVVLGMEVFDSFESDEVAGTGIVPLPQAGEKSLGGHAVCVVGYNDVKGHLIVRNSWGISWGDKGYFYLPYAYVNQHTWDYWTARV